MLKKLFTGMFLGSLIVSGFTVVQASELKIVDSQSENVKFLMANEKEVAEGLIELSCPETGMVLAYSIVEEITEDFHNSEAYSYLNEKENIEISQLNTKAVVSGNFNWTITNAGKKVGNEEFTAKTGGVLNVDVTAQTGGKGYTIGFNNGSVFYGLKSATGTQSFDNIITSSNLNGLKVKFGITANTLNTCTFSGGYTYAN